MKENIETCIRNKPKTKPDIIWFSTGEGEIYYKKINHCTVKDRTPSIEECRNCEWYDPKFSLKEFLGIFDEIEIEV